MVADGISQWLTFDQLDARIDTAHAWVLTIIGHYLDRGLAL